MSAVRIQSATLKAEVRASSPSTRQASVSLGFNGAFVGFFFSHHFSSFNVRQRGSLGYSNIRFIRTFYYPRVYNRDQTTIAFQGCLVTDIENICVQLWHCVCYFFIFIFFKSIFYIRPTASELTMRHSAIVHLICLFTVVWRVCRHGSVRKPDTSY